jgi:hypothetical protein
MKIQTLGKKLSYSRTDQSYKEALRKISNKLNKIELGSNEMINLYDITYKAWKNKKRNKEII